MYTYMLTNDASVEKKEKIFNLKKEEKTILINKTGNTLMKH